MSGMAASKPRRTQGSSASREIAGAASESKEGYARWPKTVGSDPDEHLVRVGRAAN